MVKIEISQLLEGGKKNVVSTGKGSYLESISFDDKPPIWDINMKETKTKFRKPRYNSDDNFLLLVSDSATRPDAIAISKKEWEQAEEDKKKLETL